ncbi:MAG: hypothetical protein HKN68_02345 [Saprospiraceae bacterium]|nr:hypothetical protein [Saprospiraceae bacterium]
MKKLCLVLFLSFFFFTCTETENNEESDFESTLKVEFEFFSTGATYVLDEKNPTTSTISDVEFNVEFSTVAGSSEFDLDENMFRTTFDNPEVLGKLIRGKMRVGFADDFVGVYVDQSRQYESLVSGSVSEFYEIGMIGIPLADIITESTGEEVYIFELSGQSVCNALTSEVYYRRNFTTINDKGNSVQAEETLTNLSCGERSLVTVRVYLPE